jgi:ATP:ADP antiporter, AAA family
MQVMGIEKQELKAVVPTCSSAFFLLGGYAFFRPAINSLYKEVYGSQALPIAMGLGVGAVLVAVWLYVRVLSRVGPRRTLTISLVGSAFLIFIHYLGLMSQFHWLVLTGYLLKEAYIVLIIEQYWSFLNSKISSSNAKKLFGAVLGFSSIGSILGSRISAAIVVDLGSETMLLIAAGLTLFAVVFAELGFRWAGEPDYDENKQRNLSRPMALNLFRSNPVLKYIFLVIVLTQVFSAATELRFNSILEHDFQTAELQNQYENRFWSWVESAGLVLNFVVSPVLLSFIPLRVIHFLFPILHLGSAVALMVHPSIETATVSFFLFKCTDYSVFRAAKEMLYIPFSFDVRYRAKEVIDVFGYRAGKGGVSFAIYGLQGMLGSALSSVYSWIALAAAGAWILVVPALTQRAPRVPSDPDER